MTSEASKSQMFCLSRSGSRSGRSGQSGEGLGFRVSARSLQNRSTDPKSGGQVSDIVGDDLPPALLEVPPPPLPCNCARVNQATCWNCTVGDTKHTAR